MNHSTEMAQLMPTWQFDGLDALNTLRLSKSCGTKAPASVVGGTVVGAAVVGAGVD
jgi:hypothetical protein